MRLQRLLKLELTLVLMVVALLSISCQKKKDRKTPVTSRSGYGNGLPDSTLDPNQSNNQYSCSYSNSELSGFFFVDNAQQDQGFWNGIFNVLSGVNSDPVNYFGLGNVSGQCGANTGIRFTGHVELQSGPLNVNGANNSYVSPNSYIGFVIFDEFSAQQGAPGIGIGSQRVEGQVNGNQANLTLYWEGGTVQFNGTIYQNQFSGDVSYSQGYGQGQWWSHFSIPTCQFFRCQ